MSEDPREKLFSSRGRAPIGFLPLPDGPRFPSGMRLTELSAGAASAPGYRVDIKSPLEQICELQALPQQFWERNPRERVWGIGKWGAGKRADGHSCTDQALQGAGIPDVMQYP